MIEVQKIIYKTLDEEDLRNSVSWLALQHISIQKFYWESEDIIELAKEESLDTGELVSEVIQRWASNYLDLEATRAMNSNPNPLI